MILILIGLSGGISMIIFGYLKLTALYKLKRKGIKAIGEIENIINPESNILSELSYVPEVKFNIKNLEIIGVPKNSIRSNPTFYKKGRKYLIYYCSKNPNNFVIDYWKEKAIAWFMIFGGIILFILILSTI